MLKDKRLDPRDPHDFAELVKSHGPKAALMARLAKTRNKAKRAELRRIIGEI